jgi:hypothetical protein
VIEADLEQIRRRGVARDVPAELRMGAVGAHDHRERVPAHDRRDALLELEVARELRLLGELDRVLVRRVEHGGQRHAPDAGVIEKLAQEKRRSLPPLGRYQGVEGLQPLAGFGRVGVGRVDAPEGRGTDIG